MAKVRICSCRTGKHSPDFDSLRAETMSFWYLDTGQHRDHWPHLLEACSGGIMRAVSRDPNNVLILCGLITEVCK